MNRKKFVKLFKASFGQLTDKRRSSKGNFRYPLVEVLFLSLAAILTGASTYAEIAHFGKVRLSWLKKFFPYKNGTPSEDTIGRIFRQIVEPSEFQRASLKFLGRLFPAQGSSIAIDGKTIRRSYDKSKGQTSFHVVTAFILESYISLSVRWSQTKGNEINMIREILEEIDLKDTLISIDAIGCQREFAKKIVAGGGDWLFGLKNNQKLLLEEVKMSFDRIDATNCHRTVEKRSNYVVRIDYKVIRDLKWLTEREKWSGLKSLIKVQERVEDIESGQVSFIERYYISSRALTSQQAAAYTRGHWKIENLLHRNLDVLYLEDYSRRRKKYSAININLLFKIGISLLLNHKRDDLSIKLMFRQALSDSRYLTNLLLG